MYRITSFIIIFSFVSVMIYFHIQNGHFQAADDEEEHHHGIIAVPNGTAAPSIDGEVMEDSSGSWLLKIKTTNFTFTPEKAGKEEINYNEGHAHIYLDGKKINRLYGNYYNLGELESGIHEVKVTVNANDHRVFSVMGEEISFKERFEVNKR
ncbi:hypothetical protein [Mesobacillus jeotgali]|uniref:hypothetical protein n=1 Tax=Mesobacillus jeotgali TaxID=129985 RepID=UPI0009A7FE88|nr:hypothetical protein [Mesobacillus jeotgali]